MASPIALKTILLMVFPSLAAVLSVEALGQSMLQVATSSSFAPGGQTLFVVDLATVRAGTRPTGIEVLSGSFDVVSRNGTMMLRVTEHAEFLIRLPNDQRLPQNFTVEVDLVPKANGPEPDLTLEGTAAINQDVGSAHVQLLADASFGTIYIVGGEANISEFPIPDLIRATLPQTLTRVGMSVEGKTIRFFINGEEISPDPQQPTQKVQAQFARGNVLRVTLGGLTDGAVVQPVYLARLRVATGAPVTVATALPATTSGTITPISTPTTPTAGGLPPVRSRPGLQPMGTGVAAEGLTITGTPTTASLSWNAVPGAVSYQVTRGLQGSMSSATVLATNITTTTFAGDVVPDPTKTYTYSVFAYQADGTYGIAKADFLAPKATDPTAFTASSPQSGTVELTWQSVASVSQYHVSGPGIPPNAQTAGTKFVVSGVKPGLHAYRVASLYPPGGTLTPSSAWPTANAKVAPEPKVPWLSMSNGVGSLAQYNLHACNAAKWISTQVSFNANTWCDLPNNQSAANTAAYPLLAAFQVQEVWTPYFNGINTQIGAVDQFVPIHEWTTFKHWKWAKDNQRAPDAIFVDEADLGKGRTVGCVQQGTGAAASTLCWGKSDPGVLSVIVQTQQETHFLLFDDRARTPVLALDCLRPPVIPVAVWGCAQLLGVPFTNLDSRGLRYAPHACLSCHGGTYDATTGKVTGASLLPLDPRGFQRNAAGGFDPGVEEQIRRVNLMVYNSNSSPLVKRYINDLYRGRQALHGAVVDEAFVPTGWTTQSGLYQNVYRPFCATCHNTQTGTLGFRSFADLVREKVRVRHAVCSGTMPHAEVPFRKFWSEGGPSVSWPGVLLQALGESSC